MSDCDQTFERLSMFVDDELDDGEAESVERHVASCERCQSRLASLKATKHKVATLGTSREATDAVRRKIEREAGGESERYVLGWSGATVWRGSLVVLMAAGFLVAGYLLGMMGASQMSEEWAETFVADHKNSKPAAKPMDVAGNNPDEMMSFFRNQVGFEPVVPTFSRLELVGGRLCKLAGRRVELLFYQHEGEVVSLFISDKLDVPGTCRQTGEHGVCASERDGLKYMLVGRLPTTDLREFLDDMSV